MVTRTGFGSLVRVSEQRQCESFGAETARENRNRVEESGPRCVEHRYWLREQSSV